jgi:holliday junction DNA helicase RuvA
VIGYLKGTLVAKRPPWLTVDVAGIGYEVEAPMSTFYQLPDIGAPVTLVTHLHVREDAHVLYGFSSEAERSLFRSLLKISGIGARMALGILSGMSTAGFYRCVRERDLGSLTRVPGIGRKTAERLLVEMADRPARLPPPRAGLARVKRTARCSRSVISPVRLRACSRISIRSGSRPKS